MSPCIKHLWRRALDLFFVHVLRLKKFDLVLHQGAVTQHWRTYGYSWMLEVTVSPVDPHTPQGQPLRPIKLEEVN